jgi:uncharacterized protein (DUF58 family)
MDLDDVTKTMKELEVFSHRKVTELFAGNYKSAFKGAGIEVKQIREYVPGDEVKYIDWTASARLGKLYIKEFQETRELTTMLLVDVSASMNFGSQALKKEALLQVVAILLYSALKNNDAMGMVIFGGSTLQYIPPKKGNVQLLRCLSTLIDELNGNRYTAANAQEAIVFFNRVVKKQAITFLITDELQMQAMHAVKLATKRHDFVVVNVYDAFERKPENVGLVRVEDPETGRQLLVDFGNTRLRQEYIEAYELRVCEWYQLLRRYEVDVVDIESGSDVYKGLLLFFKKRQLRS